MLECAYRLMLAHFCEAGASVCREPCLDEGVVVKLAKGLGVEGVLEMLKGQSKVENGGIL